MSDYKVPYVYHIYKGSITNEIELNPGDYLDYDNEDDLHYVVYDAVFDEIWDNLNTENLNIDQGDMDFCLPEEFINEWKKLKGYEV